MASPLGAVLLMALVAHPVAAPDRVGPGAGRSPQAVPLNTHLSPQGGTFEPGVAGARPSAGRVTTLARQHLQ